MSFRLTYATMFNPPEAMHERFESALASVTTALGWRTTRSHRRHGRRDGQPRRAASPSTVDCG